MMPSQAAAVQAGPRGERMSWKLRFNNDPMMSLSYRPYRRLCRANRSLCFDAKQKEKTVEKSQVKT